MSEERLLQLKAALEQSFLAPDVYMFKFIVPANNEMLARVMALFDASAVINSKPSSEGKYISVTARETMLSVEAIVEKYRKAFTIEGLIAL